MIVKIAKKTSISQCQTVPDYVGPVQAWFLIVSLLTMAAAHTFEATAWREGVLTALAAMCCMLAISVCKQTGLRPMSLAGTAVGLFVGQWWVTRPLLGAISKAYADVYKAFSALV